MGDYIPYTYRLYPIHTQMPAPLTVDAARPPTSGMKMIYFSTGEDTSKKKKKVSNSKFKPHDVEADKPGKSQLDLETSRELAGSLKKED